MQVRYIATKRWGVFELTQGTDGLWRDSDGSIWALADYAHTSDTVNRCGIGVASLDVNNPLTKDCKPHDYAYSCLAFQVFYTRLQADDYLATLVRFDRDAGLWRLMALPAWILSRLYFWKKWGRDGSS